MDGWKPVERTIREEVLLDQAVERAQTLDFAVTTRNPGHVILRRDGTQWTLKGERFPLEMALAEAEEGLFLQLRYDTFVLGDTGDLERFADEVVVEVLAGRTPVRG